MEEKLEERIKSYTPKRIEKILKYLEEKNLNRTYVYKQFSDLKKKLSN